MNRAGRPLAMPVEDRKKEIYAAAEDLFGARGYEKVTMSDIAAAVGMSKKTLYVHFADKPALLKALVSSSYIWPEGGSTQPGAEPVQALKHCLLAIAEHVLSARHLKLCRLAIGESIGMPGLAETFYQMGICHSRASLIAAVQQIAPGQQRVPLSAEVLADMLFGACIGRVLIDALLGAELPEPAQTLRLIDEVVAALFNAE